MTPKQKLEKQLWELQLEIAVTYPIDHEAIATLVKDLSKDEIARIPYLPNRAAYIQ